MVTLPSVNASKWRFRNWGYDLVVALSSLGLAGLLLARTIRDPNAGASEIVGAMVLPLIIAGASVKKSLISRTQELKADAIREPPEIRAWIKNTLGEIQNHPNGTASGMRIVVYKLHHRAGEPTELEQISEYHGGDGGVIGRKRSIRSGIIGRVARVGEPFDAGRSSADVDAFRVELVRDWGFTKREAAEISLDRWSWFGVPLLQPENDEPYGVVFFDARAQGAFDDSSAGGLKEMLLRACSDLATTCFECYNR